MDRECGEGKGVVNEKGMEKFLAWDFYQPKEPAAKKEYAKQIKTIVRDIFTAFDVDKDKYLNEDEFLAWAQSSPLSQPPITLLNQFESFLLTPGYSSPSSSPSFFILFINILFLFTFIREYLFLNYSN